MLPMFSQLALTLTRKGIILPSSQIQHGGPVAEEETPAADQACLAELLLFFFFFLGLQGYFQILL